MVTHAFTCWVLVCFLSHVIIFAIGERTNAVSGDCSEKFYKIIQKTVVMEYFHSKLADLQPEKKFLIKKGLCVSWICSEQPLCRKLRGNWPFFIYCINLVTQKFCESNYCKAALVVKSIQLLLIFSAYLRCCTFH